MNVYMQILFIFGAGAFLTWWFLKGLLNPFLEAAFSIVITGLFVVVSFFLNPFISLARSVTHFLRKIFRPVWVKIIVYSFLGIGIIVLDHFYATTIYAEDETVFYHYIILGKTYWITQAAFRIGGFFLFLDAIYILDVILKGLNKLLNHPMRISIVVQK